MTLQQFIDQNNGKYLDWDGFYGAQCVDLVQFWSRNLGGPQFTGNAATIFGQGRGFYDSIGNTPIGVPSPGDIMVWGSSLNGGPGHTSVFVSGDASKFTSFDENWPLNTPAHLQAHDYHYVVGWLHPKLKEEQMKPSPKDVGDVYRGLTGNDISQQELDQYISLDNGILALVKNLIPGVQKARDSVKLLENERDTVLYPAFDELKKLKATDPVKKLDQIKQIVN